MRRLVWLIVVCLGLASPLAAQMPKYCGQLSADDCALMRDAQASLGSLDSATILRASMSERGLGSVPDSTFEFSIRGVIGGLAAGSIMNFQNLSDLNADLTLSADLYNMPDDEAPTWADIPDIPDHTTVHVRLVDGVLYIDADSLTPPLEDPDLHGWMHIDLSTLVPQPAPTPAEPTPTSDPALLDPVATGTNVDRLAEALDREVMDQFVTVARTGDVIETRIDFAGLYANPVFQAALREDMLKLWQHLGMAGDITDEKIARLAAQMAEIFPEPVTLFAITVDPETRTARGLRAWGLFDFTTMIQAGLIGNDISGWGNSSFEMAVDFDDFNAVERVAAPEESRPISSETLHSIPIMRLLFPPGEMQPAAMSS